MLFSQNRYMFYFIRNCQHFAKLVITLYMFTKNVWRSQVFHIIPNIWCYLLKLALSVEVGVVDVACGYQQSLSHPINAWSHSRFFYCEFIANLTTNLISILSVYWLSLYLLLKSVCLHQDGGKLLILNSIVISKIKQLGRFC